MLEISRELIGRNQIPGRSRPLARRVLPVSTTSMNLVARPNQWAATLPWSRTGLDSLQPGGPASRQLDAGQR